MIISIWMKNISQQGLHINISACYELNPQKNSALPP